MENNKSKYSKLEIFFSLKKKEHLLKSFKTLQGFIESKKITGLKLDDIFPADNMSINISKLSFNINSVQNSFSENISINSEFDSPNFDSNSESSNSKLIKKNQKQTKKVYEASKFKNNDILIEDHYKKILNGTDFPDDDNKSVNFSIKTQDFLDYNLQKKAKKDYKEKIHFKENKILEEKNRTRKESFNTTKMSIDEEEDINEEISRRKKTVIKKAVTMMNVKKVDGMKMGKSRFRSKFIEKKKIFVFDQISNNDFSDNDFSEKSENSNSDD